MRLLQIFLLIIFTGYFTACKKDAYQLYEQAAMLQFGPDTSMLYNPNVAYTDSAQSFTFVYSKASVVQDTAWFNIYAIGGISDKDRSFSLRQVQVDGADNAVPGVHYKSFNDPSVAGLYVIKAGKRHAFVPVVTLRDASLKKGPVVMRLEIAGNENFKAGEQLNAWRKLYITDRVVRPAAWNSYMESVVVGKYSEVKHLFMIEVTGKNWDQEFMLKLQADFSAQDYYKVVLATALIDYNNAHPGQPLRDENNQLIEFR